MMAGKWYIKKPQFDCDEVGPSGEGGSLGVVVQSPPMIFRRSRFRFAVVKNGELNCLTMRVSAKIA